MPVLMPTPEEMKRLTPGQRDRIRRAVWAILAETDRVAAREAARARETTEWAEQVRDHARALLAYMPKEDPATILARRAVLEGKG